MANPFAVHRSPEGDFVVLSLEGYLDAHTAPQFETAVQNEMEKGHLQLIVEGSKLSYISSAGLGVFMSFIEEIRDRGGDIKICGIAPKVRQVFEILGFDELFDMVDDVPAACQRFADSPQKES